MERRIKIERKDRKTKRKGKISTRRGEIERERKEGTSKVEIVELIR